MVAVAVLNALHNTPSCRRRNSILADKNPSFKISPRCWSRERKCSWRFQMIQRKLFTSPQATDKLPYCDTSPAVRANDLSPNSRCILEGWSRALHGWCREIITVNFISRKGPWVYFIFISGKINRAWGAFVLLGFSAEKSPSPSFVFKPFL